MSSVVGIASDGDAPSNEVDSTPPVEAASWYEHLGASIDDKLEKAFTWWGTLCASRPWAVLAITTVLIIAMCVGIRSTRITTDPVELWASPTSRSRLERKYFDEHFQPFYRTEQVIIRAVGLDKIYHNTSDGVLEFGPIFNPEFLFPVLKLQQEIKKVGTAKPSFLNDV